VDDIAETAVTQLRAAEFITMVTPDVMPYKWGKLLRNLGNSIGAITDYTGDEIAFIGRAARQEARDILTRAGIRWVSDKELAEEWPESTSKPRNSIPLGPENSTWQSLARRQGTVEADYLNGEIVRLAKGLGRKAPINEGLLRISYQMATDRERPGKYSPAQLSVMLGLDQPQTLEANDTG
jgi:2-dehydropantoate 2-reductase